MTMFEFMQNAFFLLCGIICIAAAVLVMPPFFFRGRRNENAQAFDVDGSP